MRSFDCTADYAAVRHVLEAPSVARRTRAYIRDDDFDWPELLDEAARMSGGERLLVYAAHDLWHAGDTIRIWELARRLDSSGFERVMDALYLCHTGLLAPAVARRQAAERRRMAERIDREDADTGELDLTLVELPYWR